MGAGQRKSAVAWSVEGPGVWKQNICKLAMSKYLDKELLSMAKEQHCQLGAQAQIFSMDSENEVKDWEQIKPRTTMASAEVSNISQMHAALLKEIVFDTVPGMVNVRRGVAAQTAGISSSE